MSDKDLDHKLGDLFHEAHGADEPPLFRRVWSIAPEQKWKRWPRWIWASAVTAVGLLSILSSLHSPGTRQPRQNADRTTWTEVSDPLAFLLDTPGADLLRAVPTFDTKGNWR